MPLARCKRCDKLVAIVAGAPVAPGELARVWRPVEHDGCDGHLHPYDGRGEGGAPPARGEA